MEFEGDMDEILDNVMCSTDEDEPRFRKLLKKAIKNGEVPKFDLFDTDMEKKKKARQKRVNDFMSLKIFFKMFFFFCY